MDFKSLISFWSGFISASDLPAENTPDAAEMEQLSDDLASQGMGSIVGETLEDMSLSSTSSLDRNDISQEYMDDFDNLGETLFRCFAVNISVEATNMSVGDVFM